uniref:Uncharacterized protein n=1 Tax=Arundo donax TaxID=35708 RepID=A0A0A9FLU7_ARUDO
MDFASASL